MYSFSGRNGLRKTDSVNFSCSTSAVVRSLGFSSSGPNLTSEKSGFGFDAYSSKSFGSGRTFGLTDGFSLTSTPSV